MRVNGSELPGVLNDEEPFGAWHYPEQGGEQRGLARIPVKTCLRMPWPYAEPLSLTCDRANLHILIRAIRADQAPIAEDTRDARTPLSPRAPHVSLNIGVHVVQRLERSAVAGHQENPPGR